MEKVARLDERCTRLRKHLVDLQNEEAFLRRVHGGIKALGFSSSSRLVSYYDVVLLSGFFDDDDVPFKKSRRLAYQKEYRIVAKTPKSVRSPLIIDIGDISDIAMLTTADEFNAKLRVKADPV